MAQFLLEIGQSRIFGHFGHFQGRFRSTSTNFRIKIQKAYDAPSKISSGPGGPIGGSRPQIYKKTRETMIYGRCGAAVQILVNAKHYTPLFIVLYQLVLPTW